MLSKFSVKKPFTILVSVIMVLMLGAISFTKTTTDLLPEMELPYMVVYTSYPGASAEKVETEVTTVIENAVGTTENLLNINSVSSDNLSVVVLQFADDTNMDTATIDLSTKLNQASSMLGDNVSSPALMAMNPDLMPVMTLTVDYENMGVLELSDFVDHHVLKEIEKTKGVANVTTDCLLKETVQIFLDQDKIDSINNRIIGSVDSELAKAEKEIRDGLKEVNEGLDKVNQGIKDVDDKKKESFEEMSKLSVQLNEAATNLLTMSNHITELKAYQATFTGIVGGVDQAKEGLGLSADASSADVISAIETKTSTLSGLITVLNGEDLNTIKGVLASLPNADVTTIMAATSKEQLQPIIDGVIGGFNETITSLNSLKELAGKYDDAKVRLNQIDIEIKTSEEVYNTAKSFLDKAGIDTSDLSKVQADLESGKLVASGEFTKGEITLVNTKAQLEATKKQLESSLDDLKDAKAEALKKANVDSFLNAQMISQILMAENFDMPAGYIANDDASILVKVGDEFASLDEIQNLLLMSLDVDGLEEVRLSDVANISIVDNHEDIYTKVNGNDAILMSIQKNSTVSTSEVSKQLKKTFNNLEGEYEGLRFTPLFDQGIYIDVIIDSVLDNFIYGALLAIVVLIIFLKDFKPTLVIALAIPFSFMFALVLMYFSGVTINLISLTGLALAVGMLVDNSVVVVENIYRLKLEGKDYKEAAIEGANQVASAIISSTLTTICVFLPIVFTEGMTRQLFTDMGLTIAYSLIASLIVALTLVPTLASTLMKKTKVVDHSWFNKVCDGYGRSLEKALKHRGLILIAVLLLFIATLFGSTRMGMELLPEMDSNQITLSVSLDDPDMPLDDQKVIYDDIMERVQGLEGIDAIGTTLNAGMMMSADTTTFYVLAAKDADIPYLKEAIPSSIEDLPITTSLSANQMDLSALGGQGITIKIVGDDLDEIKHAAEDLKSELLTFDGIAEVDNGIEDPQPEFRINVDKNKAMEYGLTIAQVYQSVAAEIMTSTKAGKVTIDNKTYDAKIATEGIDSKEDLMNLNLKGQKDGKEVEFALKDVATFTDDFGMSSINRENSRRFLSVNATIEEGHNIALVSREIEDKIPYDHYGDHITLEFTGENEMINEAMVNIVQMIALAIAFIYMIMVAQFQSLKAPFIVMFTIPLAFTGGLLALFLTGLNLSMISMLGFLVLSGVVVNNGIVLIDYINQLREAGVEDHESLILAGKTRLRPILMTALTTILSMVTVALGVGQGSAMMQGMAVVTIGGLTFSTILTLYVVPIMVSLMGHKKKHKLQA